MICCSEEQHDNGISHGCNWRFYISACYEEPQTVAWQSSLLPPSGQRVNYTIQILHYGRGWISAFTCVRVGVSMPRTCLSSPCVPRNAPDTRGAPGDSPLLGPLGSRGWGGIFISSSENARAHVCSLRDEYVICLTPAGQEGETLRGWWIITRHSQDGESKSGVTGWQQWLIWFCTRLLVN